MLVTAVAVEKLGFPENWLKTDDQKCIRIRRKSFIGHPGATIFPCALGERVFQQPLALSLTIPVQPARSTANVLNEVLRREFKFRRCGRYGTAQKAVIGSGVKSIRMKKVGTRRLELLTSTVSKFFVAV